MTQKSSNSGVKFLLSAAALAGTVGGWALITHSAAATQPQPAAAAVVAAPVDLPPLPTLVAPPAAGSVPAAAQPGAQTSAQVTAPSAPPPLRVVSAPPAPVTTTRSSR
jgi:hypothetical protein